MRVRMTGYVAAALALRDRIIDRWMESTRETYQRGDKRVYYLSLEFLVGRSFRDCMTNLELTEAMAGALDDLGVDIETVREHEPDAALGNGGLGRLAACFMESLASLGMPAMGYGIRYDYGLFRQAIRDGAQHEGPGGLAGLRQSVGIRASRGDLRDRLRWRRYRRDHGERACAPRLAPPRRQSRPSLTTRPWSAGAASG